MKFMTSKTPIGDDERKARLRAERLFFSDPPKDPETLQHERDFRVFNAAQSETFKDSFGLTPKEKSAL